MLNPTNQTEESKHYYPNPQQFYTNPPQFYPNPPYPQPEYTQTGGQFPEQYAVSPNYYLPGPPLTGEQYIPPEYLPPPPEKSNTFSRFCGRLIFIIIVVSIISISALDVLRWWIFQMENMLLVEIRNHRVASFKPQEPSEFIWEADLSMRNPFWYSSLEFEKVLGNLTYKEQMVTQNDMGRFVIQNLEQKNFVVRFTMSNITKDSEWVRELQTAPDNVGIKFDFHMLSAVKHKIVTIRSPRAIVVSSLCKGLDSSKAVSIHDDSKSCKVQYHR